MTLRRSKHHQTRNEVTEINPVFILCPFLALSVCLKSIYPGFNPAQSSWLLFVEARAKPVPQQLHQHRSRRTQRTQARPEPAPHAGHSLMLQCLSEKSYLY